MFDSSKWSPEKEARYENLAPATGIAPLPLSFVQLTMTFALVGMGMNPWLRPWLKLYSK
jgi:hypothetical protein